MHFYVKPSLLSMAILSLKFCFQLLGRSRTTKGSKKLVEKIKNENSESIDSMGPVT